MKKIIATLFLSLAPLMAMESKAPEVEMYPDDMPKLFLYSEGVFLDKQSRILPKNHYSIDEIVWYNKNYNDASSLYLSSIENNNKAIIIRDVFKAKDFETSTIMTPANMYVCRSFLKKNKWDVPRHVSPYEGDIISVNSLSWYHISSFFHIRPELSCFHKDFPENPKLDLLYQNIASQGLPSQVTRWLITRTKEKYHIYFVYNDEKELSEKPDLEFSTF